MYDMSSGGLGVASSPESPESSSVHVHAPSTTGSQVLPFNVHSLIDGL